MIAVPIARVALSLYSLFAQNSQRVYSALCTSVVYSTMMFVVLGTEAEHLQKEYSTLAVYAMCAMHMQSRRPELWGQLRHRRSLLCWYYTCCYLQRSGIWIDQSTVRILNYCFRKVKPSQVNLLANCAKYNVNYKTIKQYKAQ